MKRFSGLLLIVWIVLTAAPAWAQPQTYISGNLGFGIRPDADISISTLPFEMTRPL